MKGSRFVGAVRQGRSALREASGRFEGKGTELTFSASILGEMLGKL